MLMRLQQYACLLRLDKPIGIFLLLWPTLWALWLASSGHPDSKVLFIFLTGTLLMRSAGCAINDFADRRFDAHVARTQDRPLANGKITSAEALMLAAILALMAFLLVLFCNALTIKLAFAGVLFAWIYPFMKRVTHLPQLGLGLAFSWGVPMAFAAQANVLSWQAWFVFVAAFIWPIIYDSMYAMVDKIDDVKVGIKSTAILFDRYDKIIIAALQIAFIILMGVLGFVFGLTKIYFLSVVGAALLFIYQQYLIRMREPKRCFRAFLNNNLVGFVLFAGIFLSFK